MTARSCQVLWKALATLVIMVVLLALPVGVFIDNLSSSGGAQKLLRPVTVLSPPRDNYYGTPTEITPPDKGSPSSDICVTFEFLGLDPATSNGNFGILIGVTGQGKTEIIHLEHLRYTRVTLWITSNSGLSSIQIPVLLSLLAHPNHVSTCGSGRVSLTCPLPEKDIICPAELDQDAASRAVRNIFVLGQAPAFPDDWYQLNDSVTVRAGQDSNGDWLPSSLIMMTRDEDYSTTAHIDIRSGRIWPYTHQLMFIMRRPWSTIFYTYWIATIPFILLVVLLAFQFISKHIDAPKPYEVAFGVAATLVAILPLRTVLVPSSLPGLTRLDIYFGIWISFLVALSIIWFLIWFRVPASGSTSSISWPRIWADNGKLSSEDDQAPPPN